MRSREQEAEKVEAVCGAVSDGIYERGERLAKRFHELYEAAAPAFGYKTRDASAVPWEDVPSPNRQLMIAVCIAVEDDLRQRIAADIMGAVAPWRSELQNAALNSASQIALGST